MADSFVNHIESCLRSANELQGFVLIRQYLDKSRKFLIRCSFDDLHVVHSLQDRISVLIDIASDGKDQSGDLVYQPPVIPSHSVPFLQAP